MIEPEILALNLIGYGDLGMEEASTWICVSSMHICALLIIKQWQMRSQYVDYKLYELSVWVEVRMGVCVTTGPYPLK